MDRAAEAMVEVLEDRTKNPDGSYKIDLKERKETFLLAERWLKSRQKLLPDEQADAGVDLLRNMLADPRDVVKRLAGDPAFIEALEDLGWLRPPEKLKGRPTLAQADQRATYERERVARYDGQPPTPKPTEGAGWAEFGIGADADA